MSAEQDKDIYKLWLEEVGRLRALRHAHTQFNVTLNIAGAAGLGFLFQYADRWFFSLWIVVGMLLVNLSWVATDKWFSSETGRKFTQLIELEESMDRKFITRDRAEADWRKTNWLDWVLGIEVLMPRMSATAFLLFGLWTIWQHT